MHFNRKLSIVFFFISIPIIILLITVLSQIGVLPKFDRPPFILLNLLFSTQAAYAAPIIMMSQNRQDLKDRIRSENDYTVDVKAEKEVREIQAKLNHMMGELDIALKKIGESESKILSILENQSETTNLYKQQLKLHESDMK